MIGRLLALALLLTVCVHLAGDVLDPLLELAHHTPAALDASAGDNRNMHCEATEPFCADPSIPEAPALSPARMASLAAVERLRQAAADPLPHEFFRPPLAPRLS